MSLIRHIVAAAAAVAHARVARELAMQLVDEDDLVRKLQSRKEATWKISLA